MPGLRCVALLLACMFTAGVGAVGPGDFLYGTAQAGGSSMPYRYYVPPAYDGSTSLPLILFLHGSGELGSNNEAQLDNHANGAMYLLEGDNAAEQPVFMVAPQAWGWWADNQVDLAIVAVEQMMATYNVDAERVYVTGLSMGGMGTWRAIVRRADLFAAAVPMSGSENGLDAVTFAPLLRHIPTWFFHAANDGTVNVAGSDAITAALRDAGARVLYTRYATGGHGIWSNAYRTPLLFHWLVSQRRGIPDELAAPTVHIVTPVEADELSTTAAQLDLAGIADQGDDVIASVAWDVRGGGSGPAVGTSAWTVDALPLEPGENLVRVTATGPSGFAAWGGQTRFNDAIRITRAADAIFADGFELP